MLQTIRRYINRHTVVVAVVYVLLLWLFAKYGTPRMLGALVVGTIAIGGIWLWMKAMLRHPGTVTCTCGGQVTAFAGRCPCGGHLKQPQSLVPPTQSDWEDRRTVN